MEKYIIHVDMDAFFAAVEKRDNPELKGKPVIVGADPKQGKGRGVVSTCSYEARKYGICSAMPISIAYKICRKGIFLPVDMGRYRKVSKDIHEIFYNFTPKVERVSIDEAFLDITGSYHIFGCPLKVCSMLKTKITREIGLTASVGLAPTKMAAKIASDLKKPDGLVVVTREGLTGFLWPLNISRIGGVGKKNQKLLGDMGIKTIGDMAKTDSGKLKNIFGKSGEYFWRLANGIDEREVETEEIIKSISNEITFDRDSMDREKIKGALIGLCEKVSNRLRRNDFKAKTIILKVRLEGFHTYTRSKSLVKSTNFVDTIYKTAKKLFDDFDSRGKRIRLVGVKVSNFIPQDVKDSLLDEAADEKKERMHKAVEKINVKFGNDAIYRAGRLYFSDN